MGVAGIVDVEYEENKDKVNNVVEHRPDFSPPEFACHLRGAWPAGGTQIGHGQERQSSVIIFLQEFQLTPSRVKRRVTLQDNIYSISRLKLGKLLPLLILKVGGHFRGQYRLYLNNTLS